MALRRGYIPGEIIYSGCPYFVTVKKDGKVCSTCLESSSLKACTGCNFVKYCSKKCQKESWQDHTLECALLKKWDSSEELRNTSRLIGLLILKLKGKSWEDIYEVIDGEKVTVASLPLYSKEIKKDSQKMFHIKEIKHQLKKYIGVENMPNEDDVWNLIVKIYYNKLFFQGCGVKGSDLSSVDALILGASKVEHSCIPNAEYDLSKREVVIRATAHIPRGEKVTISLFPTICLPSSPSMEKDVRKLFIGGSCRCEDCSKPYGTSILSKLLDESKAYSVLKSSEDIIRIAEIMEKYDLEKRINPHLVVSCLEEQEGVLGETHIYRIRVMALLYMFLDIPDSDEEKGLEKLIKCMEKAFGEYHREVRLLYSVLRKCSARLGNIAKVIQLTEKIEEFEKMGFDKRKINVFSTVK